MSTAPMSRMGPSVSSVTLSSVAKNSALGSTRVWTNADSGPLVVPGLASTNDEKLATYRGSATLFRPDSANSIPTAAWTTALDARATFPLAGSALPDAVGPDP